MKLVLVTDAWQPQVNGVVTSLVELVKELNLAGHTVEVIHPGMFQTKPCPGYAGIDLAVKPKNQLQNLLKSMAFDAIHLATEGPLGWAARSICQKNKWFYTTAYHTRFPEILKAALKLPLWVGYAIFKHFHRHSAGVMVPTIGVLNLLSKQGFRNLKPWTHGVDVNLFDYSHEPAAYPPLAHLKRPLAIFVGRVSYEKNIETFLKMPFEGSKVVCGVGPLEADLKKRYAGITWLGLLPRPELARVYSTADVFVFPSRHETFGLVMLEAMACGTPVAAFPVDGPQEVLLNHQTGVIKGGVLGDDLAAATQSALNIPRYLARERAMEFSWEKSSTSFIENLVSAKPIAW
ncbi:MAG: glycosyltransferase family 1 protein [Burkholderiales bacterium]|nr:glycosyltransferase family 1 protein [Burkholderiales bacterium]